MANVILLLLILASQNFSERALKILNYQRGISLESNAACGQVARL
jgi:hypothetical protein